MTFFNGSELISPPVHTQPVTCVACSPTEESLFVSCGQVRFLHPTHRQVETWENRLSFKSVKSAWLMDKSIILQYLIYLIFVSEGWSCADVGQKETKQTRITNR